MYRWIESAERLNRYAFRPSAGEAAFTVHYWGANGKHHSNPLHKHSFFEICYVLDGGGSYWEDGTCYPLCKGVLFCSRPGIVHQIRSDQGLMLVFVAFELDDSASADIHRHAFTRLMNANTICVHDADDSPTALLWRSLLVPQDSFRALPEDALSAAGAALLLTFPELFVGAVSEADRPVPRQRSSFALKRAKLYIADNLSDQDLSLAKVASYLNMSQRHLSRLFSSGIRESFTDYVRRLRVQKAAELLAETELSIADIAERTGFGSVHYFSRIFRQLMNETPARYRSHAVRGTRFV